MAEKPGCPVHKILSKLKRFAGLPVPFMVQWHEGKPDFRVMDMQAFVRCVQEHLCGICGEKLGATVWWIGGPLTLQHGMFTDPAMHKTCALESMRLCPYLRGARTESRLGGYHPEVYVHEGVTVARPETMYLMYSWTKHMSLSYAANCILSGPRTVERQF